jgi:hypothetical protein
MYIQISAALPPLNAASSRVSEADVQKAEWHSLNAHISESTLASCTSNESRTFAAPLICLSVVSRQLDLLFLGGPYIRCVLF